MVATERITFRDFLERFKAEGLSCASNIRKNKIITQLYGLFSLFAAIPGDWGGMCAL